MKSHSKLKIIIAVIVAVLLLLGAYSYGYSVGKNEGYKDAANALQERIAALAKAGSAQNSSSSSSATDKSASANSSNAAKTDDGEIDPDVKAFGESYEQFIDEYVAFMQKYMSEDSTSQAAMIGDYTSMLKQEVDMAEKANELDAQEANWNTATQNYWIDLSGRCAQKMLSVTSNQ